MRALEKRTAHLPLQPRYRKAQGRLRQVQGIRGPAEVQLRREGLKYLRSRSSTEIPSASVHANVTVSCLSRIPSGPHRVFTFGSACSIRVLRRTAHRPCPLCPASAPHTASGHDWPESAATVLYATAISGRAHPLHPLPSRPVRLRLMPPSSLESASGLRISSAVTLQPGFRRHRRRRRPFTCITTTQNKTEALVPHRRSNSSP